MDKDSGHGTSSSPCHDGMGITTSSKDDVPSQRNEVAHESKVHDDRIEAESSLAEESKSPATASQERTCTADAPPDDTPSTDPEASPTPLYSLFTIPQKRLIVVLAAFAALFSPLSSFIYFPATTALARSLGTTVELINLSITTYMAVSGIAPALIGDAADKLGRRPIFLGAMVVYMLANLGLALQHSYAALLVLRAIQSLGSAGTIALSFGVVADIASPAERGGYVGIIAAGPNCAPPLGPVLGGLLVHYAGWRWIFWFLLILSGACFTLLYLFLPETARVRVGAGGRSPSAHTGLRRYVVPLQSHAPRPAVPCFVPNPLGSVRVLLHRNAAVVIFLHSVFYMTFSCVQASVSSTFIQRYGYNSLQAGLVYLPFGVGCLMFTFLSGLIIDRDYRLTAQPLGFYDVQRADLTNFPIEGARFRSLPVFIVLAASSIVGYGWSVERRVHVSVPLLMQFLIGASITVVFNMCGTLVTDLHPRQPATAQAALNIVKASFAAGGLALVEVLIERVGPGWCFTVFGAAVAVMLLPCWVERTCGLRWRREGSGRGGNADGEGEKQEKQEDVDVDVDVCRSQGAGEAPSAETQDEKGKVLDATRLVVDDGTEGRKHATTFHEEPGASEGQLRNDVPFSTSVASSG